MSAAIAIWLGLVVSSTIALVTAVVLAVRVVRLREGSLVQRLGVALVPPWAALVVLRGGRIVAPSLFALAVGSYLVLQIAAAMMAPS